MIVEFPIDKRKNLLPLFSEHKYLRLLLEGLLQEGIGTAFVNNIENPTVALIGREIIFFLAGDYKDPAVQKLLELIPSQRLIFLPSEEWVIKLKEYWGDKLHTYQRTKFSSKDLNIKHMQEIQKNLPKEMVIEKLTKVTISNISKQAKSIIGLLFTSLDNFLERNFGFCILEGKNIASLALAASPINKGHFEIHIETNPNYQRRGLAMISCAKLIEYSLEKGLVPHWDADNEPSAKLALKLGYTEPEKYNAYFWIDSQK